jgi:hypothetical protein
MLFVLRFSRFALSPLVFLCLPSPLFFSLSSLYFLVCLYPSSLFIFLWPFIRLERVNEAVNSPPLAGLLIGLETGSWVGDVVRFWCHFFLLNRSPEEGDEQ